MSDPLEKARALRERYQQRFNSMSEDDPEFATVGNTINQLDRKLSDHLATQRQTDENGKLTADAPSLHPTSVGVRQPSGPYNFHFEPSVGEVQRMLKAKPELAQQWGVQRLFDPATEDKIEEVVDPGSGASVGQSVTPGKSHLDLLTEKDSDYTTVADKIWEQRMAEAQARGEAIQRYSKVKLEDQPLQYLAGGTEQLARNYVEPAAASIGNVLSAGTLGSVAKRTAEGLNNSPPMNINGREVRFNIPYESPEEIMDRNPPVAGAAGMLAYAMPMNPVNLATEMMLAKAGYAAPGLLTKSAAGLGSLGKAALSTAVGATVNTGEGFVRDTVTGTNEGQSLPEAASNAAENIPLNLAFGGGLSFLGETSAQVIGGLRKGYRRAEKNANLRTLEAAGGGTHFGWGIHGTPEIEEFTRQAHVPGENASPGALAAEHVAPDIEQSITTQAKDEHAKIAGQMDEYFSHPAYNTREVDSKNILESLVDLARPGSFRSPLTGELRNVDPTIVKAIGKEISNLGEVRFVSAADAPRVAHETGGSVIDTDLARQLFSAGDGSDIPAGAVAIAVGAPLTAERLTALERRIDRELGINNVRTAGNEDPVFESLNRATKQARDQFPLYRDEAGNLVAPPEGPRSQAPFAPVDTPRQPSAAPGEGVRVLPAPRAIEGAQSTPPEAMPGVGPGQPALPASPFDQRAPAEPQSPLQAMAAPQPVVGTPDPAARPEGLMGVGPGQPDLPNPFDPRLPVSRESIQPLAPENVSGPPRMVEPESQRGIGPEFKPPEEPARPQGESQFDKNSQPAPTATEYSENTRELGNWYDNITQPGAEARSGEAKRLGDLTEQQRAMEEAQGQLRNAEDRLGPMDPAQREQNLLRLLSQKLGREVTKEDLIKAGLITGAGVAAVTSDDDDTKAAAGIGGLAAIIGKPRLNTLSKEAQAAISELGFIKPENLKGPKTVAAVIEHLASSGIPEAELSELTKTIQGLHESSAAGTVDAKPSKQSTGYGADRNIGKSLKLGERFSGDSYDADALIKKSKKEFKPPPKVNQFAVSKENGLPADPAARELMKVSKRAYDALPDEEKHAVDAWTGQSGAIRAEQRNGIPLYREGALSPKFEAAIDKLMVVDPTKHGILYRRFNAEPKELAELLQNGQFEVGANMSSSYKSLETFGPHELRIKKATRAGALIGENTSEAEMIIPEGSRFKVTNRWFDPKKNGFVFELEEVPVTKANLMDKVGYLAVPAGAGIGAALSDDDDEGGGAAAGAIIGGGGKHLKPSQLEAVLEDGTKVKGFSALRRMQHTEQKAIELAKKRIGVGQDQTVANRIRTFGQNEGRTGTDRTLLEEARKIGKEPELRTAAGAAVYQSLKDQTNPMANNKGFWAGARDFAGFRLEKLAELMSGSFAPGHERNPFAREPNTALGSIQRAMLEDPARRLLNLSGGRVGARFGDDAAKIYREFQRQSDERDRKQQ